jgi:hypothetical protein
MACGLTGGDGDSDGKSPVTVISAAMGTEVNERFQVLRAQNVFPKSTQRIYASIVFRDAKPGMNVLGRWYQLSVMDAPPNGKEVTSGGLTLEDVNIVQGTARVALSQTTTDGFPLGDWLVRVYVNGTLVRTMGFVVLPDAGISPEPPPPAPPPPAPATPGPSPTSPPAPSATPAPTGSPAPPR